MTAAEQMVTQMEVLAQYGYVVTVRTRQGEDSTQVTCTLGHLYMAGHPKTFWGMTPPEAMAVAYKAWLDDGPWLAIFDVTAGGDTERTVCNDS